MTESCPVRVRGDGRQATAAARFARWLGLAASPTFATMAALTAVLGAGSVDMLCSAGHASPASGMVAMYLLMSAFHSSAWLRLVADRGDSAGR